MMTASNLPVFESNPTRPTGLECLLIKALRSNHVNALGPNLWVQPRSAFSAYRRRRNISTRFPAVALAASCSAPCGGPF